jgi:hypothetical protein
VIQHSTINNLAIGRSTVDELDEENPDSFTVLFSFLPSKLVVIAALCPAGFALCAGEPR